MPLAATSRAKLIDSATRSPSIDRVDETGRNRVTAFERPARHAHVEGLRDADQPREPLCAFRAGNDPEVHLGLANQRVGDGDAIVPRHRELEPAAERRAMDRHDDRLAAVLDPGEEVVKVGGRSAIAPRRLLQAGDIGARDERLSRALEHDRANRHVLLRCRERLDDGVGHTGAERIDRRMVDFEEPHTVVCTDLYGVRHSRVLSSSSAAM